MPSRDTIKEVILELQEFATTIQIIPRTLFFEGAMNYVFIGLRRCGKSYMLYQRIAELLKAGHSPKEILYINFEDDRLDGLTLQDLDSIKTCYEELFDTRPIFFLDEIQIVDGWEKFARRLADQKYRVYITGSNAKMLAGEIATTLGGRYMVQDVFPYSFNEFLFANGIDIVERNIMLTEKTRIARLFEEYFSFGGLPEVLSMRDKRSYLSNLYNKIFFGDIITRHKIRNELALKMLVRKLSESLQQPKSYTRLANIVSGTGKKVSVDTIIEYIAYLKESFLIFSIENITAALVDKESTKKYYFLDNGIVNLFLTNPGTILLENLVAVRLHELYGEKLYYYKDNVEVDFVVYEEKKAFQACYSLMDEETKRREIDALVRLAGYYDINELYIVTKDESGEIESKGKTIKVLRAMDFALGYV